LSRISLLKIVFFPFLWNSSRPFFYPPFAFIFEQFFFSVSLRRKFFFLKLFYWVGFLNLFQIFFLFPVCSTRVFFLLFFIFWSIIISLRLFSSSKIQISCLMPLGIKTLSKFHSQIYKQTWQYEYEGVKKSFYFRLNSLMLLQQWNQRKVCVSS